MDQEVLSSEQAAEVAAWWFQAFEDQHNQKG